ncbi:MAG: response regulator [Planctomycetota bacterium]|nr:MAG: response regulator [Planctomycetota bacterium]
MGGTMEIQSVQNEGTKISLFLPMASEPVKPSKPMPPRGEHRGCENILVVEDQVEVSELVSTVLERRGYSVEVAAHGREALERLNSKPNGFQLVLSDVVMPVMGGVELFRALRRQGVEIPILLMSGYVEDARALPALPGGDPPFLAKPFTAQGLLTAIRQLLDEKLEKTLP